MMNKIIVIVIITCILMGMTACLQVSSYDDPALPSDFLQEPHRFLRKYLRFSQKDLLAMEKGEVVAKVFDTREVENEVGAFGVVRLNIPKEFFLEQFRDIVAFTESDVVEQIAKFSDPPRIEDLQKLTLDDKDFIALKTCKPGDCDFKIDTTMMKRFQEEVDWSAPDCQEQATALMRQFLIDYVTAYLEKGDAALGEYHDQSPPLRIADAFHELFENSPYFSEYVPELYTYLHEFPHGQLPQVENFLYWSKEAFGLRPVINLFHVTIYPRKQGDSTELFITSKQIYASHYFETSLSFTAFVDEIGGEYPPDSYLMYLNRSRFDNLRGSLKGLVVTLARNSVYEGVKTYFRKIKERLEAQQMVNHLPTH